MSFTTDLLAMRHRFADCNVVALLSGGNIHTTGSGARFHQEMGLTAASSAIPGWRLDGEALPPNWLLPELSSGSPPLSNDFLMSR
jgi:hypothetical protein